MRFTMLIVASVSALALVACSQSTQEHAAQAANQAEAATASAGQDTAANVKSAAASSAA